MYLIAGGQSKLLGECCWQLEAGAEVLGTTESDPENTAISFTGEGITVGFVTVLNQSILEFLVQLFS